MGLNPFTACSSNVRVKAARSYPLLLGRLLYGLTLHFGRNTKGDSGPRIPGKEGAPVSPGRQCWSEQHNWSNWRSSPGFPPDALPAEQQ